MPRQPGRPVSFDADRYPGRNVVGHGFNRLRNGGVLATRYDGRVVHHRGGTVLRAGPSQL